MTRRTGMFILAAVAAGGFVAGGIFTSKMISVNAQTKPGYGAAALAGERVGQDVDGPYNVDPNWPKPISALPGHEKWTYGATESVYRRKPQSRVHSRARGNSAT